jgi:hypothetical protein
MNDGGDTHFSQAVVTVLQQPSTRDAGSSGNHGHFHFQMVKAQEAVSNLISRFGLPRLSVQPLLVALIPGVIVLPHCLTTLLT